MFELHVSFHGKHTNACQILDATPQEGFLFCMQPGGAGDVNYSRLTCLLHTDDVEPTAVSDLQRSAAIVVGDDMGTLPPFEEDTACWVWHSADGALQV